MENPIKATVQPEAAPPEQRLVVKNKIAERQNPAGSRDLFARILRAVEEEAEEQKRNGVPGPNSGTPGDAGRKNEHRREAR